MFETISKEEFIKQIKDVVDNAEQDESTIKTIIVGLNELFKLSINDEKLSLPTYNNLPISETTSQMKEIINLWNRFIEANDNNLSNNDVDINEYNLCEVIERVNKRRYHYIVFHNINELSEIKETALLCYWIVKLKPFTILNKNSPLRNSPNEYFALYLILSILQYLTFNKSKQSFQKPSDAFLKDLIYILKYRELSKEAMILLVSSIAQCYGITIDNWI